MAQAIISCSPHFAEAAQNELRRSQPETQILQTLAPGVFQVKLPSFQAVANYWQQRPPVYSHHLCPVQKQHTLVHADVGTQHVVAQLRTVLKSCLPHFKPGLSFAVQVRLYGDICCALANRIEAELEALIRKRTKLPADSRWPRQILSLVIAQDEAYFGVSERGQNLSPWPGGARLFPPDPYRINRAELKLLEALETFNLRLPAGGRVLDLGAAPGGWTRALAQHGQQVTAVDSKPFNELLLKHSAIRSYMTTAEDFLATQPAPFDLITNDMIMDAQDSARLMLAYANYLKPDGMAIMTLKLRERQRLRVLDHALRILRKAYKIPRLRQLYYNRNEVTAWLKKR